MGLGQQLVFDRARPPGNPEGGSPGWAYQVRADVTDPLNNAPGVSQGPAQREPRSTLPVTVANVQAGTGLNRYAGWNLVVVWEQPTRGLPRHHAVRRV